MSFSETSTFLHQRIVSGSEKGKEEDSLSSETTEHLTQLRWPDSSEVEEEKEEDSLSSESTEYHPQIRWPDLCAQLFIHGGAFYGIYLMVTAAQWRTVLWAFGLVYTSGFGITAGAHRLWSHRAYKAAWPLRLLLVFLFTITGQRHVHAWALDHRVHHKFSETNSDPHDARRGFWFSHVGWLVLTPHPDVEARRKAVDMSDLDSDPILVWQKRLYVPLFALLCIAFPVLVPYYFWNEDLITSFWVSFNFRFAFNLNMAFAVNSFAHMYGSRPYDKAISPVENVLVSLGALGEGWHNYHHVFPYDYKTSELGKYSVNWTTGFIDMFASIGWAFDCKTVSEQMVRRRAQRCGDGSHHGLWGFGDSDMPEEDRRELDSRNSA